MTDTGDLRVSPRGQMSLPSIARRQWGLEDGGTVAYVFLGDSIVIAPGDLAALRAQLLDGITDDIWAEAHDGFGDPDLATQ